MLSQNTIGAIIMGQSQDVSSHCGSLVGSKWSRVKFITIGYIEIFAPQCYITLKDKTLEEF